MCVRVHAGVRELLKASTCPGGENSATGSLMRSNQNIIVGRTQEEELNGRGLQY